MSAKKIETTEVIETSAEETVTPNSNRIAALKRVVTNPTLITAAISVAVLGAVIAVKARNLEVVDETDDI